MHTGRAVRKDGAVPTTVDHCTAARGADHGVPQMYMQVQVQVQGSGM